MEESQVQTFLERVLTLCPKAAPEAREALESPHAYATFVSTQIDSPLRFKHFFAQVCHESGGLRVIEENLRYSAKRLTEVWPKRFPTIESALPYAWDSSDPDREDIALANLSYGPRLGNELNGVKDDDGWKYRGRGLIQITGLTNYRQIGHFVNLPLEADPDLVLEPDNLLLTTCFWWSMNGCNALADTDDVEAVTWRVNGGLNGLEDRKRWLRKLEALWTS